MDPRSSAVGSNQVVGIMSAMQQEANTLLPHIQNQTKTQIGKREFGP